MEKETLRYEISYLEQCFIFMVNSKKNLEDNIEVIIKSSTKNQKNIRQLKSKKKSFCEHVVGFKDVYEKSVEILKKCIDELKTIRTELESSNTKSLDETNKSFKSNLVTRQSLERVFSVFITTYFQVFANLIKLESLLQKENEVLKSHVKRLLEQFKVLKNEMTKVETERNMKVQRIEELKVKRILFCQNKIQQLEEETVRLKKRIDSSFSDSIRSSVRTGRRRKWGVYQSNQQHRIRREDRDRRVQSLERQVEEYRREINELKEQVENLNRLL